MNESPSTNVKSPSLLGFIIVVAAALVLYLLMTLLPTGEAWLPYGTWAEKAPNNLLYRIYWFFGDVTEAQFYKSLFGGIGVLLFGWLAWALASKKSNLAGFSICYSTGLWPWIAGSSLLGLFFSDFVFNYVGILGIPRGMELGWIPTFVPVVSIPAAVIFVYGGNWRNLLTGAILGGLIGFPIAYFVIDKMLAPAGLPFVIGNVTGMWLGSIITLEICRHLPWMKPIPAPGAPEQPDLDKSSTVWFVRRVLADFSEAQFYGNEVASVGLLLGTVLSWYIGANHPSYGSGLLPHIILSQALASAIGVLLYFRRWEELGWYPTFVPVVSIAPAIVLTYGGTWQSIVFGALLGALIGPPVAQMILDRLPKGWHPVVGNTFSMALSTALVAWVLQYMPGFGQPWFW